jgi:hypothetical protein
LVDVVKTPLIRLPKIDGNCLVKLRATFCGFAKAGLFSTTVHLKNHTSIIRKNCQPKHCTPAFAKPLLVAAVLVLNVL